MHFNPPTPCGVGQIQQSIPERQPRFQSTHPVWGGTLQTITDDFKARISIHPPRMGWDKSCKDGDMLSDISIHPPRVGWDQRFFCDYWWCWLYFNPPTPCGVGH